LKTEAHRRIGRDQSGGAGRDSHHQQGEHKGGFPTIAIAVGAENQPADRRMMNPTPNVAKLLSSDTTGSPPGKKLRPIAPAKKPKIEKSNSSKNPPMMTD
jgi:hypothetical protein